MGIFSHRRNANRRLRTLKGFCDLLRCSFPAVQHFELPAGQQIVPFFPSIHQFQVSFSRSTSEKRSRVKTKTINIQRYLYHETFFSKQYITLLRIFRQIYIKQLAKWPTNDTLDGGSERERRKLGEPISIRRAATPSLPRFRPTTQFRNFTRLRCSIDKLFRACCTRAGACAFQRGVHCRCTHPRLTPFLFIFQ